MAKTVTWGGGGGGFSLIGFNLMPTAHCPFKVHTGKFV